MLRVGLIDANEKASRQYAGLAVSVISGWLRWEAERAGLRFVRPDEADIVLVAFAGALDYRASVSRELRRWKIPIDAGARNRRPYLITGGPVDATPLTALSICDALAVGEGYKFVRRLFAMVRGGCGLDEIRQWIIEYPHAIEREQILGLRRDPERPWLYVDPAPVLAEPDPWVDWEGMPPVQSDDKVVRLVGSKGCHLKCSFCATTYRQTYRRDENELRVLGRLEALKRAGHRVQIISNDPANLPYFERVATRLDSQSFTILEIGNPRIRDAVIRAGIGIARFGVEGISERIRTAFGKAIPNDDLLAIIADLHSRKTNSHMFFIVGAPFEAEADYDNFRQFLRRLVDIVDWGICRLKYTKFTPTPPAPLARYVPGSGYVQRMEALYGWAMANCASRHVVHIWARKRDHYVSDVADQLSISRAQAEALVPYDDTTLDLLPTPDDARRAIWEIVRWPIDVERRWKIADVYRRKMLETGTGASAARRVAVR